MLGIINLRGKIVPILDLRQLVASGQQAAGPERGSEVGEKVIVVTGTGGVFLSLCNIISKARATFLPSTFTSKE